MSDLTDLWGAMYGGGMEKVAAEKATSAAKPPYSGAARGVREGLREGGRGQTGGLDLKRKGRAALMEMYQEGQKARIPPIGGTGYTLPARENMRYDPPVRESMRYDPPVREGMRYDPPVREGMKYTLPAAPTSKTAPPAASDVKDRALRDVARAREAKLTSEDAARNKARDEFRKEKAANEGASWYTVPR